MTEDCKSPGGRPATDGAEQSGLPAAQAAIALAMAGDAATLVELFDTLAADPADPDDRQTFVVLQAVAGVMGILCDALVPPGASTRWCNGPLQWLVGFRAEQALAEVQRAAVRDWAPALPRAGSAVLATTLARMAAGLGQRLSDLIGGAHEESQVLAGAASMTERIGRLADDLAEALGGERIEPDPLRWIAGTHVVAALQQLQASAREGAAA